MENATKQIEIDLKSFKLYYLFKIIAQKSLKKLTAPGIPKPSPIQVLTGPNVAWLARSDGMAYFQRGMVVSERNASDFALVTTVALEAFVAFLCC